MRRLLCACAAIALIAPSQAVAQNFPDIPDNHLSYFVFNPLTPRAIKLSNILFDAGLIERRDLRGIGGIVRSGNSGDMYRELQIQMSLLRVHLGVVKASDADFENAWLIGWQKNVPVLEELLSEVLGERYTSPDNKSWIKEDIRVIKDRFAARGMPVNENRFKDFSDVPESHWAFKAISRMRKAGILFGYPDGTFRG